MKPQRLIGILAASLVATALLSLLARSGNRHRIAEDGLEVGASVLQDDFESLAIDESKWIRLQEGELEGLVVETMDGRLRMACDTRNTLDIPVKTVGLRSAKPLLWNEGRRVRLDIDWNRQENACYLSAGIHVTDPRSGDSLRIEYIGVPPGLMGRLMVSSCHGGVERLHFTEGWPQSREGRPLRIQRLEILFGREGSLSLTENGRRLCSGIGAAWPSWAFVELRLSSHSNYPMREVFFDNFRADAIQLNRVSRKTMLPP